MLINFILMWVAIQNDYNNAAENYGKLLYSLLF